MNARTDPLLHVRPSATARLAECEAVIRDGITGWNAAGLATREIRDERLYRESHETFEDYCREVWGWSRSHAYRMIEAAEAAEAQARASAGRAAHLAEENARLEADNARLDRLRRQLEDDCAETDEALRDCQTQLGDRDAAIAVHRGLQRGLRARADALASQRRPRTAGGAA